MVLINIKMQALLPSSTGTLNKHKWWQSQCDDRGTYSWDGGKAQAIHVPFVKAFHTDDAWNYPPDGAVPTCMPATNVASYHYLFAYKSTWRMWLTRCPYRRGNRLPLVPGRVRPLLSITGVTACPSLPPHCHGSVSPVASETQWGF